MIRIFNTKRVLAVPASWLNSVAAWCLGVYSPRGTVEIKNTASPKAGGGSLQLDVNIEKVAKLCRDALDANRELTETERKLVKGIIAGSIDQKYVVYKNQLIGLDIDRISEALDFAKVREVEAQTDSQYAPKNDYTVALASETASDKLERMGESAYAAREDHQHPLNVDDTTEPSQAVKNGEDPSVGTSTYYARADHVHDLPELDSDDIAYTDSLTVGGELDELAEEYIDHEDRIAALESAEPPSSGVTSVNGQTGVVVVNADNLAYTDTESIGDILDDYIDVVVEPLANQTENRLLVSDGSDGLKAYTVGADATHTRYLRLAAGSTGVVSVGTIPSSDIIDSSCTSGGDCFAYFTSDKKLAHLGNNGFTVSKANTLDRTFEFSGSGANMTARLKINAAGQSAAPTSKKVIGFASGATTASLLDVAVLTDTAPSADGNTASVGSSSDAARADHVHPKSTIYADANHTHTADKITGTANASHRTFVGFAKGGTTGVKTELGAGDIVASANSSYRRFVLFAKSATEASVATLAHTDIIRTATSDGRRKFILYSNGATAASAGDLLPTDIYNSTTTSSGSRKVIMFEHGSTVSKADTLKASDIVDNDCTSGGECLAYFDSNKQLKHLGNTGITVSKGNCMAGDFTFTGTGSDMTGVLNYKAFGASQAPTSKKVVIIAANGSVASLDDATFANLQPNAVDSTKPAWDTQAEVAAAAPKAIAAVTQANGGANESASAKIARIGTSQYAAREDHVHPFEHATGANENIKVKVSSGKSSVPSGYPLDTNTWTRDSTGTYNSSGTKTSDAYNGVRIQCITRTERIGDEDAHYWRYLYFDKNGCLYSLSAEQGCILSKNENFY